MGKINILHIYQNSQIGGIQQQILSLIKEYDRELFNPVFCCLGPKKEMMQEIEKLGIDCVSLNREKYHRISPGIVPDLYRLIKKRRIHIVRTHKYRSNFYGRPAARLAGVPVISSEHNIYLDKELRLSRRLINKLLSGITDKMVAVSEAIRNDIIKYDRVNPSKVLVMRNGVDTERFNGMTDPSDVRKEFSLKEEDIILGFIGRLVLNKGLKYLIDTVAILKKEVKNLKLFIVGKGGLMDELKDMAKKNNVHENVIFTGERRDIPAMLSCFDIFIMPSIKEGLPNALLEAMASGKPVVATDIGGIPEVIKNGTNGLLVPPHDPGSLAEAIRSLIENKSLAKKTGQAARKFIEEHHSIKSTARKWQSLYLSILQEKGHITANMKKRTHEKHLEETQL